MFENLLRIAMEKFENTFHRREVQEAAPHVIKNATAPPSSNDDPELRILADKYGELEPGKQIQVTLQELLALIPRTRRRSDAYRGLASKLEGLGVKLNIATNRSKQER